MVNGFGFVVLSTFYSDGLSSQPNNIDIIFSEKQRVIKSDFKMYLKDINQVVELERTISSLRDSKKIKLLIKFGLLNKF